MKYPAWSAAEAAFLDRLAGDLPFAELAERYRKQALRKKWPFRSDKAILTRLRRTGQRGRARHGPELTTGSAAGLLGCPGTRVEAWLRQQRINDILQPRWVGKVRYIERRAWRRLAEERPEVFGGFSASRLFLLLEDRELAESIASRYSKPLGDWRVRCIETGRIYPSCVAVAKAHHVTQAAVSVAIRQRRPVRVLGMTFEALRKAA